MKNKTIKFLTLSLLILGIMIAIFPEAQAQCPMCRMSVQSNLQNGGTDGQGLNMGILYMLATPYLIVFGVGYFWWKNRKKDEEMEWEDPARLN